MNRSLSPTALLGILMLTLLACVPAARATAWTSTATGGSWTSPGTWTANSGTPATGDTVTIATTGANSVTLAANTTIAGVVVNSGATLDENGYTLTDNGNFSNSGTVKNGSGGNRPVLVFNTPGTYSFTPGYNNVAVAVQGGGGNGAGTASANWYCSGGGGGGCAYSPALTVVNNTAYTVTVGSGGSSSSSLATGISGGNSVFTDGGSINLIGGGGGGGKRTVKTGGTAGTASGGTYNYSGGAGSVSTWTTANAAGGNSGGGGGGAGTAAAGSNTGTISGTGTGGTGGGTAGTPAGGDGGAAVSSGSSGNGGNGNAPGGGGAGGTRNASSSNLLGGAGGNGQVVITLLLAASPTTQPTLGAFTSVGGGAMTVNWSGGDGASYLVLVQAGGAVNANPVSGTSYTANSTFGLGSQIGTGNYVCYLGSGTSVALSGLLSGVTYYVAVYAFNGANGAENYLTTSPATGSQATTSCTPPPVPSAPSVTAGCGSVTVGWTAVAGVSNNVYRSASGGAYSVIAVNQTGSSYVDSAVTAGITYNYEISAVGDCASANSSPSSGVSPLGVPASSPSITSVTPDCSSLTVNWTYGGADASSYNVYRKVSGGSYGAALATGLTSTSYQDSTAAAGNAYVYAVTAVNSCGENATKSGDSTATAVNAPGIGTQPASVTTGDGGYTATFTVGATGAGLTYQWMTNNGSGYVSVGSGGGGQTAIYTTPYLTTAYNGLLVKCVVTGGSGACAGQQVNSSAATLTVGTYFKSVATGNWSASTTWQISPNGSTGWAAAPSGVIPTNTDPVEIASGTRVTVDTNAFTGNSYAASLTIDSGGAVANWASSASSLYLYGNLAANNGSASFTNNGSTAHAFTLRLHSGNPNTGTDTWTGSGDVSGSKVSLLVDPGVTLDISGVTSPGIKSLSGTGGTTYVIDGTLIAGNNVINANGNVNCLFTLASGATLQTANVNGITNAANTAMLQFATAPTLSSGASYVFNGNAAQVAAGLPATVNGLTINNNSGVTLAGASTATSLTLTSGQLTTSSGNLLTIAAGGSITGGSSTAFVNGPLAQIYSATGSKSFPLGQNGNYRAVALNLTTLSGTPTITVTPHEASTFAGTTPSGITLFTTRDWTVASSVGSGNVGTLTLDGTGFTPTGVGVLVDYNGTSTASLTTVATPPSYSAAGISLTSSSDVALGDCTPPDALGSAPTVSGGSCAAVTVSWTGNGAASYNVYRKLNGGSYGSPLATGQTGTSYQDSNFVSGNSYVYAVTAVSTCGGESALSADSSPVSPSIAPTILTSPQSVTNADGHTSLFSVVANGATAYQWQVSTNGGGTWNNAVEGVDGTGSTSANFTTAAATLAMNGYQYQCVVTGGCPPAATSGAALLSVATYFKSQASGFYSTNLTWQISTNGTSGWAPAPAGVIPGAGDAVEIQSGNLVIVDTNATCQAGSLTIDAGGTIANWATAASSLRLYGNLAANNGSASFTNNNSTSHALTLNFVSGNDLWTGSGDTSSNKISVNVESAAVLDISGTTAGVLLRVNGNVSFSVSGTLVCGNQTISGNSNPNSTFTNAPGSTIATAGVNGFAGLVTGFNSASFNPAGNYVFNGTAAQVTTGLPAAVNNLIISNSAGVTLSAAVTAAGSLSINSGALNLGGYTSTAGYLFFAGAQQATGSWGPGSPAPTHVDATHFAGTGLVNLNYNLTLAGVATNSPTCSQGSNGGFTVAAAGGSGTYTYSTNGTVFQSSGVFTGLPAGTYTVTASDAAGGTATTTVAISQPVALAAGSPTYSRAAGVQTKIAITNLLALANKWADGTVALSSVNYSTANFASLAADSTYIYVGASGANDSFQYTLTNQTACGETAIGYVTLIATNSAAGQNTAANIVVTPTNVVIQFAGIPGYSYTVQKSTDGMATWTSVLVTNAPATGLFQYVDTVLSGSGSVFYQLKYNAPAVSALNPAVYPARNFDLSNFTVQLPINQFGVENAGAADAFGTTNVLSSIDYTNPASGDYCNGQVTNYFYTGTDGAMVFWAPDDGSTTPGSTHPRSELYNQTYFGVSGTHTLAEKCKVVQVTGSGKVCIGQIKTFSPNGQACMLFYNNGAVYAEFWTTLGGANTIYTYPGTFNLSDPITYQIQESNSVVSVTVNGVTHSETLDSTYSYAAIGNQFYFKAGCYSQNTSSASSTLGSRVAAYALTATP
jgi:fibronectin type 3 domain-containing protein